MIALVALVVALVDLALWAACALLVRHAWKRLSPTVAPYLAMFAATAPSSTEGPPPVELAPRTGQHLESCSIHRGKPCDCNRGLLD